MQIRPAIPPDYLWIAEALLTFLVLGLGFALAVGILLLARPQAVAAISARLNRWIDTSEHFRRLERPRNLERAFYRHHRLIGGLVVVSAVFVLWRWLGPPPRASLHLLLAGYPNVDWLAPAIDALIVCLHGFVLAVGAVIFVRPSALKHVEKAANQWHRVPAVIDVDAVATPLDAGFELHPRVGGVLLIAGATTGLVILLPYLAGPLGG